MHDFRVIAPGLDTETIERAEAAAQAEFDAAGVTAMQAATAHFKLECAEREYDVTDPNVPRLLGLTEQEFGAALAWMGAGQVAAKACYGDGGLQATPEGWNFITPRAREI